jgi:cation diffusion facilitator family transporter
MRAALTGLLVNISLVIGKLLAGIAGHSYALVADAIESSTDIFSSLVVWGGLRVATRPADDDFPYGYGRAEPLAAAVVSFMLLGAALGIAVAAVGEIITPHHMPAPFTLVVIVIVVSIKELLFRRVIRVGVEIGSTAVKADAWHHRSDAITSAAAFVGISIALWGGPGWESADDWASLAALVIDEVLEPLPRFYRSIIEMRDEGYQIAEIAEGTRRSKRAVERVLQDFGRKLGAQIGESA